MDEGSLWRTTFEAHEGKRCAAAVNENPTGGVDKCYAEGD